MDVMLLNKLRIIGFSISWYMRMIITGKVQHFHGNGSPNIPE